MRPANIVILVIVVFVLYLYIYDYIQNRKQKDKLDRETEDIEKKRFPDPDTRQNLIDLNRRLREHNVIRHLTNCPKCSELHFDDEPHNCKK